jgi:asparagine synthase (glutamine-hydrolysing)
MCGIAGLMGTGGDEADSQTLERMMTALRHRGPDGEGSYAARNVALGQTRLAIIDLETGSQPLYEPGGAVLVANGEIYNYLELRDELGVDGFVTGSDCEPPLHLYRRYGLDFVDHLRGMYAIALYDPIEGQLVLARDPFGIKPLYYAQTSAGFAFASEPQALIAAGWITPSVSAGPRAELFQLQFTAGSGTLFEGISRVLPGESVVVRDGRIVARRRRAALPVEGTASWSEGEALERLDAALRNSVEVHQRSDVPYGMFLSGGVDSAVLLSLMKDLNDQPVHAFTAGFVGTTVSDERKHARAVADAAGATTVDIQIGPDDFWRDLPRIAGAMDDPTADYAIVPTFLLAESVRREGLKVVLTGDGGDELFAGYGRYRSATRPWWRGGRSMRSRGVFDGLGVLRDTPTGWRDSFAASEQTVDTGEMTRLQIAQAIDCADWLPNDLLLKVDRCLMANGVEGRTPFLDPEVAAIGFRLPDALKVQDGLGKWLLRRWLHRAMPEAKPFERKRGFSVPVAEWIEAAAFEIGPLVAHHPGVMEVCEPKAVESLFAKSGKRQGFATWVLLFYALWHNHHVLGIRDVENVRDALEAGKLVA